MIQVDAAVKDTDDHVGRAGPEVPGLLHPDPTQVPLEGAVQRLIRRDLRYLVALDLDDPNEVAGLAKLRDDSLLIDG